MSSPALPRAGNRKFSRQAKLQQRNILITLLFPFLFLLASWGQATVNESLETANLYVDAVTGSDSNPGTKTKPLKTIGAAAGIAQINNWASIGTKITINPGTYRESLALTHNKKDTSLPITFEAATTGTAIVSGGTKYKAWVAYGPNPSIYTNSWLHDWRVCPQLTSCPYQQDIMMRKELVAVNGTVLTQVLSFAQMQQGTFYVDEQGAQIYVWPASGTNMSTATVEVAESPTLLTIHHKSNIVVHGLTFQYANTCRASAAVLVDGDSTNILFDKDTFQWNNSQGLSITTPTTYFTVQNSVSQHNGDSGFQEATTKYGLWQSDTTSYNNWRGAQAGYYACNGAGLHGWEVHNDTIDGLTTSFNQTYGIHWDTDNKNITTSGIIATGNLMSGVFVEKNEGPVTFDKGYFCNQNSGMGVGGLVLRNSEGVSLTNSVLTNNYPSQIMVIGQKGGISVTNWETGKSKNLVTQNFTNKSNVIRGIGSDQLVFKDSYLDALDWTTFQTTLVSSSNTWWNASNSTTPFVVPEPKAGTKEDFIAWTLSTLTDATSTFSKPQSGVASACNLTPVGTDFWLTIDKASQSVSKGKSATFNLTVTPLNFTATATLIVDGVSEVKGLSSTLSPSSISTSGTSVLTVTVASTTASGTYSITVLANSGSMTRTVTTQLTVK